MVVFLVNSIVTQTPRRRCGDKIRLLFYMNPANHQLIASILAAHHISCIHLDKHDDTHESAG